MKKKVLVVVVDTDMSNETLEAKAAVDLRVHDPAAGPHVIKEIPARRVTVYDTDSE